MTRTSLQTSFILITTYLFILLFVYAAVSKLIDFETFETQLGQSPLLSAYAQWVALFVPVLEIIIAGMLCFPMFRSLGLYGFYGLMVMFTTYIIIILNFTSFTPCSCGGVLEDLGWTEHLIFNIVFIVLSGVSLFISSENKRKSLFKLTLLTLFSISIVIGIFLSSEKQIKRNNAFVRRYMPHALEKIGVYDLKFNSYYITGIHDKIYLGNFTTPLYLMSIDTTLTQIEEYRISMDSTHLPYSRVRLSVKPPYFYLGDGTVPVLFKGKVGEWNAYVHSYRDAYFTEFVVVDTTSIGILTKSSATQSNTLGLLNKSKDSINVRLNHNILKNYADGVFESNGDFIWNGLKEQFIYIYYYRNNYELMDKNLSYKATGKTIDTINKPILDVAHYSKIDRYKLGYNTIMVNRLSATYGNYLYIHSDRLGRYEREDVLRTASIIDVYNFDENTYAFSFYLYHQKEKRLKDFQIYKDVLVAIVDDQLWLYRLKPEFFKTDFSKTHTAQYQE